LGISIDKGYKCRNFAVDAAEFLTNTPTVRPPYGNIHYPEIVARAQVSRVHSDDTQYG
jgi:hypothetical protein